MTSPVLSDSAAQFRDWLALNHRHAGELMAGLRKVGSGLPSMTWPEPVDEALCFGWIDGVRGRIDDDSYAIRFTPRRRDSAWSAVDVAKMNRLIDQGRVHPAGLAAHEARSEEKSAVCSFEQERPAELSGAERRQFRQSKAAWAFFESAAPGGAGAGLRGRTTPARIARHGRRPCNARRLRYAVATRWPECPQRSPPP